MSYRVPRSLVEDFYKAYATRDADRIAPFIHDDVQWTISGPVDFLPFCGTHRGKANVLDMIQNKVKAVVQTFGFVPESIVVDGDRVAMLSVQSARRKDGCTVRYRVANIMRFCDGKVIENLSLLDSFDAVEQVIGRHLTAGTRSRFGDFVTV